MGALRLVMAGGGTGGHLFPAIALAEEFARANEGADITFMGARGGIEERLVPKYGYKMTLFDVEGLKRKKGVFGKPRAILKLMRATIGAMAKLRKIRPDGVIGAGSYSSAPVVIAARLMGIKTAVLEQNALPGLTNRVLSRMVDRVYASFEESLNYFPANKTVLLGNPVRRSLVEAEARRTKTGFTVLVFGGSQGAKAVNAAFLDSLEYMTNLYDLRVIHQTGDDGFDAALSAYKRKGLEGAIVTRFIDDMSAVYAQADLAVCRAGATSIAELTALGVPSILIPYPFAADNHQEKNARALELKGASIVITQDALTGKTLSDAIRRFHDDPARLKNARDAAKAMGRPMAARAIAEDFMTIIRAKKAA